ncbi:FKBP-type peptidyl-prolyl cis-trans isomerase [Aequorivita sublithincola DSM 14238]|uniref:Peptidyl-prolyl cis-trans isomerase n=1 Tax=Aequorivita sublithincola (strain DSM 14238 / LMG 21431 / ACAM 643 / 9-3) TaxID=746697 RepID=I3YZB9_AEQSU|nr:peptidylprolyl isomerase [Aequorivita sublithincola]AFL82337.1 FKBP-type peptidyl-prolyl cis-trans isomerase [Aequorivita sublithincola DSM 14238]
MSQVQGNETVKLHYTGKLNDGQVFDSSIQREPLEVKLGEGRLIPGFEKGLVDMKVNEKKTITIPKEEAYGEVQKELFQKIPNENLPQEIKPEVGMGLMSKNPDGSERQLRVADVKDDFIIVDANHPLAGQDLTFELELLEIK